MPRGGRMPGAGRPKGALGGHTLKAMATKQAFIDAIERNLEPILKSLMRQAKKGNVMAIKEMLDRAWGKPAQAIVGDSTNRTPIPILYVSSDNSDKKDTESHQED